MMSGRLYTAVDPGTNELLHTALELTTNKGVAHAFFAGLREKHDIDDAVFLIDGSRHRKTPVDVIAPSSDMNVTEVKIVSNVSLRK